MTVTQPQCVTCRFWAPDYIEGTEPSLGGTCRFNPPQINDRHGDRYWLWPVVDQDDWCGRHQGRGELPLVVSNAAA